MAIHQVNLWKCENEKCNHVESTFEEVEVYSSPVVIPKQNSSWGYIERNGIKILVCPKCLRESKMHSSVML